MPAKTRTRFDLIRFLDKLEAEVPEGQAVIAITDNLSTRTTRSATGSRTTPAGASSSLPNTRAG